MGELNRRIHGKEVKLTRDFTSAFINLMPVLVTKDLSK